MTKDSPYRLGLIGYPLGHSRSPELHHALLAEHGLQGEYRLYPVPPLPEGEAEIVELLGRFRRGELDGLNVTIPHKTSVLPHVDVLTAVARAVGAVNTLYLNEEGRLVGDNTDVPGFWADLQKMVGEVRGRAVVLGAGGSARAVVYALARGGWAVTVLSRRPEQATALVDSLCALPEAPTFTLAAGALTPEGLAQSTEGCTLIVNTTPLGMHPNIDSTPWPDGIKFPAGAAVYDLVYNPAETALTRAASLAGLPTRTGWGMLAEQARLAFELWVRNGG